MESQEADRLLTVAEVMDRLHVSRATVYRLIAKGGLHPVKISGSTRFAVSDVDGLVRDGWEDVK
jgi:excisionase family DNA binding protein